MNNNELIAFGVGVVVGFLCSVAGVILAMAAN